MNAIHTISSGLKMLRNGMRNLQRSWLMSAVSIFAALALLTSCADINNLLKPTNVERKQYSPVCKKSWKGKTIFIDFETGGYYWNYRYASRLAHTIRDRLIEDVVEDGCFHVQDQNTGKQYVYKVGVRIASPNMQVRNEIIEKVSADFRIKTYDSRNNLVSAKTRSVTYERPMFVVVTNNSQDELLDNYAYNVSVDIRKAVYESFK